MMLRFQGMGKGRDFQAQRERFMIIDLNSCIFLDYFHLLLLMEVKNVVSFVHRSYSLAIPIYTYR